MKGLLSWTALGLITAGAAFVPPQKSAAEWRRIVYHQVRAGLEPERFTIKLQADGQGLYWEGASDFNESEVPNTALRRIAVTPATLASVMAASNVVLTGKCETRIKHIAQTGAKTIVLEGKDTADAAPRCEFNYSDDERVNNAAATFQGIAQTMQAGARIAKKHRYDRLGLDAELDSLMGQVRQKHAIEVANISPVLQAVVNDDRVMERVRRKAARLLQDDGWTVDASEKDKAR